MWDSLGFRILEELMQARVGIKVPPSTPSKPKDLAFKVVLGESLLEAAAPGPARLKTASPTPGG